MNIPTTGSHDPQAQMLLTFVRMMESYNSIIDVVIQDIKQAEPDKAPYWDELVKLGARFVIQVGKDGLDLCALNPQGGLIGKPLLTYRQEEGGFPVEDIVSRPFMTE